MADFFVTLVGLLLAGVGPPALTLVLLRSGWLPPQATLRRLRILLSVRWLFAVLVLVFLFVVEARSVASIGIHLPEQIDIGFENLFIFQFSVQALLLMLGVGFLYYAIPLLLVELLLRKTVGTPLPDAREVFLAGQPWPRKVLVAVTAGVTEELLYRGYVLERVVDLTGSIVLAGTLSVVAATLAHRPGRTTRQTLGFVASNVGFVFAYLAFRSLLFIIVFHIVVVGLALLSTSPEDKLEQMDEAEIDEPVTNVIDDG